MKTSFAALLSLGLIPSLNVDLAVTAKTNQPIWSSLARCGLPLIFLLLGGPLQAASIIQFSATTYNVTEGMNQVEIAVQRTNDLDTVVSVDLATSNLTATAGADYLDVSARLTFLAGETNQIVAVPILNDGLVEGIETFQVLLSNPTGGAELSTRSNATVRITDNDKGLQLEFAKYQVCEDEGSVLIGVLRGDDSSFPVTVEYATADGTALAGQDYTATSGKLEFAASERLKLIRVPILNDWLKEVDETFRLYLTNATGTVLASPTSATIMIVDNDSGVQFEFNTYWVQESEGTLTVKVLRGNDVEFGAFTVDYVTMNQTATAGEDYTETKGTIEFIAGEMMRLLTIPITYDQTAEPDEKFTVTLSNPTGSGSLGKNARATVTILDTTGMVAHRFEGLTVLPNQGAQLTLDGSVHQRFKDYFDLYPIEASTDLVNWTPLATLQRTNSSLKALTHLDTGAANTDRRFYRTVTNHLVTPLRQPAGPFSVGVVSRLVHDPSRRNRYFVSTNSSFMASVWYPAVAEAGTLPARYVDEPLVRDQAWPTPLVDRLQSALAHAQPGARYLPGGASCPVVLYSHGWAGDRLSQVVEQAENLASHGYVVVSLDHFDSRGVLFPDGTFLIGDVSDAGFALAGFRDRVRDVQVVLDELALWNVSDPVLAGRLDLLKVAGMGWSWGGGVVGEVCRTDSRVRAVVLLDAYLQNADELVGLGLSKPLIGMYSTEGGGDRRLYDKTTKDAVYFVISPSMHWHFGAWYWWGYPNDLRGGRESARTIDAYTLWFLNKYLKGLDEPMPRKADYPRVTGFKQK